VADLARGAGISKGAFYRFFDSKEALYIAILQIAEAQVREGLLLAAQSTDGVRAVVRALFDILRDHPILGALADPDEYTWLMRVLPPEVLAANRIDDDRFFADLLTYLQRLGRVRDSMDPVVFAGLAPAALALALHRDLIGEARYDAVLDLLIDGIVAVLERQAEPIGATR
jgi:AcrR family transcriptional regulator